MNKAKQLGFTHIKAVMLKENQYGRPEPTDVVQAFDEITWKRMSVLKGLMWMFVENIPQPFPDDVLKPEKTGGSEMIAYKSFQNENGSGSGLTYMGK